MNLRFHRGCQCVIPLCTTLHMVGVIASASETVSCSLLAVGSFQSIPTTQGKNTSKKRMVSVGIESLFTNVSLTETITMIVDYIARHNVESKVPIIKVASLLRLCIMDVYSAFMEKNYVQTERVAKKSSLCPIFAYICVAHSKSSVTMPKSNELFYLRYVDNIFVSADISEQLDELRSEVNSLHQNICFPCKWSEDVSSLPWISRCNTGPDRSIRHSFHQRFTWTGQYLNCNSFVPAKTDEVR